MAKTLRRLPSSAVSIFKIKNRRGFAAVCRDHLTEGKNPVQAFYRMVKAVKRSGFALPGRVPQTH